MAREWALRGMSEEELAPPPKPEPPKTPRGKIENYWYHYKWHTIAAVLIIIVSSVLIGQIVTKDSPDYTVVLATQNYVSDITRERLESELEAYGRDIDGDGKVEVMIDAISFTADTQYGLANSTKFIAHLAAADIMLFIIDKESYDSKIANTEVDGYLFFTPIGVQVTGLEGDGRYWNWKEDAIRKDEAMQGMPENLFFGVRSVGGTSEKEDSKKIHEQSLELLRAYLTKKPLSNEKTVSK
ncbi:MAG: hypothetical protein PHH84_03365 [Oscillospiraceae bacterium]|nr:hypothetical protein [Oscillospiraceae bacterium]MDD4413375.1 hypothetical protein [Oscillospiraceae bacterium]